MNQRWKNAQAGIPHEEHRITRNTGSQGLQDPGSAVLGLSQCVVGHIGGLCSSAELDTASSVHARRSGHGADSTFLGG